jgi:hypothetical protein
VTELILFFWFKSSYFVAKILAAGTDWMQAEPLVEDLASLATVLAFTLTLTWLEGTRLIVINSRKITIVDFALDTDI